MLSALGLITATNYVAMMAVIIEKNSATLQSSLTLAYYCLLLLQ